MVPPVLEVRDLTKRYGATRHAAQDTRGERAGAGLGSLLRNQVAAVVIVLVGLFVVDPTLAALDESVAGFTLSGLGAAISGADGDSSELLDPVIAGLVWALYALLFVTLAAIRTARRDI